MGTDFVKGLAHTCGQCGMRTRARHDGGYKDLDDAGNNAGYRGAESAVHHFQRLKRSDNQGTTMTIRFALMADMANTDGTKPANTAAASA